jgi:uncharacterized membrane protein YhfC
MLSIEVPIQLLFPIALGYFLVRGFGLRWRIFFIGVLFFIVSQIIETPIAVGVTIFNLGLKGRPLLGALVAGLTAGFGEEIARYLGFRFTRTMRDNRTWPAALLYGAGHGGAESILVGLLAITLAVLSAFAPNLLPPELSGGAEAPWYAYFLGGIERIFAIILQVSLAVLVFQVFVRRSIGYLFLAMLYHTLIDFTTLGLQAAYENLLLTEGVVFIFAMISLGIIWYFRDKKPTLLSEPTTAGDSG